MVCIPLVLNVGLAYIQDQVLKWKHGSGVGRKASTMGPSPTKRAAPLDYLGHDVGRVLKVFLITPEEVARDGWRITVCLSCVITNRQIYRAVSEQSRHGTQSSPKYGAFSEVVHSAPVTKMLLLKLERASSLLTKDRLLSRSE
eukprot:1136670-Pelagomonas_calceolata.AAC.7